MNLCPVCCKAHYEPVGASEIVADQRGYLFTPATDDRVRTLAVTILLVTAISSITDIMGDRAIGTSITLWTPP